MNIIKAFFMAWGNFCSIPCPYRVWDDGCRRLMLAMLPVLGLLLGGMWYGFARLLLWLSFPQMLLAALLTVIPFYISGFMHLDGFMDCCDAIFSRAPLEKRKEILKDSRVGAFAVVWTIVLFLMFFASVYSWLENGAAYPEILIAIPVLSRTVGSICILKGSRLETSQYQNLDAAGAGQIVFVVLFTAAAAATCVRLTDIQALVPVLLCPVAGGIAAAGAAGSLGGVNGDVAGCSIVCAECFAVICAAIVF